LFVFFLDSLKGMLTDWVKSTHTFAKYVEKGALSEVDTYLKRTITTRHAKNAFGKQVSAVR